METITKQVDKEINDLYFEDFLIIQYAFFDKYKKYDKHKYTKEMSYFIMLLMTRAKAYYEHFIVKEESNNIKNIIYRNSNYVEKLKQIVDSNKNNEYTLNARNKMIEELNNIIDTYSITPFRSFIYNYRYANEIDAKQELLLNILYKDIKLKGVFLLDKNNKEENIKLIKSYYKIMCDDFKLNELFSLVLYPNDTITDDDVEYLSKNVPLSKISKIADKLYGESEELELLFILYILTYGIYDISINNLEEVFLSDSLEDAYYDVEEDTLNELDNLYLENNFSYAPILKHIQVKK